VFDTRFLPFYTTCVIQYTCRNQWIATQAPQQERSDEAAPPPKPTPAQVETTLADPYSPVADPSSPKLEVAPPSSPIIIISEDLTESASGEVVALSDSPIFHLIDEEDAQTQDTKDLSQDF